MKKMNNDKKRVCFLISNLNCGGGTERVTSLIANALSEIDDYDIFVLSLNGGMKPFFVMNSKIKIHSLFPTLIGSFKVRFIQTIFRIRSFLIKNKIDTLIVVDSISCLFTIPACLNLKVKHICWEHFNLLNNNGVILRDFARKLAVKYCDTVITLTNKDRQLWQTRLPNIRAEIISIANPCSFSSCMNHIPSLEFKRVLAIGRLVSVKGFDLLIEAWAQVCRKRKDWKLLIVGDGEDELGLKEQVKRLNIEEYISFISSTSNIKKYYQQASIYCMSSRYEGLPMVLLEAQVFGLPIVSFDCDTGPSEIVENGKNGLLVPVLNVSELAESLLRMMDLSPEKYNVLVQNSIRKSKEFSIERILNKWILII